MTANVSRCTASIAVGGNEYGQCNTSEWTDIVAIAAGNYRTIGLKSDGTVLAIGNNKYGACDTESWTDIVAIAAGSPTIGLKSDGTVVAVGYNEHGDAIPMDGIFGITMNLRVLLKNSLLIYLDRRIFKTPNLTLI